MSFMTVLLRASISDFWEQDIDYINMYRLVFINVSFKTKNLQLKDSVRIKTIIETR